MRAFLLLVALTSTATADDAKDAARAKLAPPPPAAVVLQLVAGGEQIYSCVRGQWKYKSAEALLSDLRGNAVGTQVGTVWTAQDGSKLTGKRLAHAEAERVGAISWVLFSTKSTGTGAFAGVKYIRRHNTVRGLDVPEKCKAGETHRAQFAASYDLYK